jgi:hypothetical protein
MTCSGTPPSSQREPTSRRRLKVQIDGRERLAAVGIEIRRLRIRRLDATRLEHRGIPRPLEPKHTGSVEELENALQGAVVDGHIDTAEIKALVDEIEETGGQHVFLFKLTPAGRAALTSATLGGQFHAPPQTVTPGFYADLPRTTCVFIGDRPNQLIVKEVYTGSFWEPDEEESVDTPKKKTRVTVLRERRAVNILRILNNGDVEIRIDRLKGANDTSLALEGLEQFKQRLAAVVDFDAHLEPVAIRAAFPAIVAAENETVMLTDRATDASASQGFSSRRDSPTRGTDVRRHPNYRLKGNNYVRDSVNIYWKIDGSDKDLVYTIVSAVDIGDDPAAPVEYTKVYFSAKVSPAELDYVITRIRHFAA